MHVGTQHSDKDDVLSVMSSFGVNHICSGEISPTLDAKWSVDGLSRLRERVEKHGITLSMVPIPLPSAYISKAEMGAVMKAAQAKVAGRADGKTLSQEVQKQLS